MPDGFSFPLVIPHGNNKKSIAATDIRRLYFAVNRDIVALKHVTKI
jgi:hypothetical protein